MIRVEISPLSNDLVLVILTSRFEGTRGMFRDGSRTFDLRSDDKDDTSAVINSPTLGTTPAARRSAITHDVACNRPHT
ncbi:hypothetical protein AVEN_260460-1, partial [Araneus ventricosus]